MNVPPYFRCPKPALETGSRVRSFACSRWKLRFTILENVTALYWPRSLRGWYSRVIFRNNNDLVCEPVRSPAGSLAASRPPRPSPPPLHVRSAHFVTAKLSRNIQYDTYLHVPGCCLVPFLSANFYYLAESNNTSLQKSNFRSFVTAARSLAIVSSPSSALLRLFVHLLLILIFS